VKTLATDLDGTLYLDKVLIDGVKSAYKSLIFNNFQILHTTNNSSQSTQVIGTKLSKLLSVDIDIKSIVTPLVVLKEFLNNKNYSLYVYGSREIKDFISNIANTVENIDNCDFIIMGRVDSPSQDELDIIVESLKSGVKGATLNKDLTYPISATEFKPGNGQIAKYVETKSKQELDSFGKEGELYSQYFLDKDVTVDYVIGDRVDTDIIFGNKIGATSVLVESSIENYMNEDIADKKFRDFAEFVSSIIQ
jgi:HAD superfamily hydrolase (TIGR01450 family)